MAGPPGPKSSVNRAPATDAPVGTENWGSERCLCQHPGRDKIHTPNTLHRLTGQTGRSGREAAMPFTLVFPELHGAHLQTQHWAKPLCGCCTLTPPLAFEGHYQGAHCPRPAAIKLDTRSLRRGSPCRERLCLPLPDPATRRTPAPCGLRALSENTKHQTFFSLPNERRNKWSKG